jgi:diketogulonate reductase-like aldo/keto reductase
MLEIPPIGLGTYNLLGKECTNIVRAALEMGYYHIDTAHAYENHKAVGAALQSFDRKQFFLTSKLALEEIDSKDIPRSIENACTRALKELGIEHLDLYLIHWPDRTLDLSAIFGALDALKTKGYIHHAGVSNFTIHHLQDLIHNGFNPEANQVEFHPYLYQKELLAFCQTEHISLIAYRPLGKGELLHVHALHKMEKVHGKTPAQILLRWLVQHRIPAIPKASSLEHLRENLDIFHFTLSQEEMDELDHLHKNKRFCGADNPEFLY